MIAPSNDRAVAAGPFRVVKRHNLGSGRIWDVYGDHIGDYLATMNPTLPVTQRSVAERICNNANAQEAAALARAGGDL
jgi:hypothetical protein